MTQVAASRPRGPAIADDGSAVVVRGLSYGYRDGGEVLRDVQFVANAGEITVILGGSGSGKTTLLRLIAGLLRPTGGEVRVLGRDPARRRLDPRVAYVPQQLGLVRSRSALDNVLVGALGHTTAFMSLLGRYSRHHRDRAAELLDTLGIGDKAAAPVYSLSGGERQRVAVARALLQEPRVFLADEFVSQLDALTSRDVLDRVRAMARDGAAVVVTTHELDVALTFADRIAVVRRGTITLSESAQDLDEAALLTAIRR